MSTNFADFHDELRAVARDYLGKIPAAQRDAERDGAAAREADWRQFAESGWLGLEVPDAMDGAGATFAEVAVILEEMGRAATPSAYFGTAVLGVGALDLVDPNAARDDLLRAVASGDARLAVVAGDPGGDAAAGASRFRLEPAAGGFRLSGRAEFVPDAPGADRVLVTALDPESRLVVVDADPNAGGVTVTDQPVLDSTRRLGSVAADGTEIAHASVWRFADDPERSARRLRDRAAIAIACDSLGLAEAMMEATVAYAGVRMQFGRQIGSFQAVKHACADMLVQISVARELLTAAVDAVAGDDPDAWVAVSMAKAHVCGSAVDIVGKAMQLHGGIGYTWESGIHVYLKRAGLNRSLFGSPTEHRKRLAARYVETGSRLAGV
jgi:alkylation response protein AidB-like acyl-CoA dehydrogenase